MIVVFHNQALFESFREIYQADERERLNPEGWRYLDRNIARSGAIA
jgi:hypothetical protein